MHPTRYVSTHVSTSAHVVEWRGEGRWVAILHGHGRTLRFTTPEAAMAALEQHDCCARDGWEMCGGCYTLLAEVVVAEGGLPALEMSTERLSALAGMPPAAVDRHRRYVARWLRYVEAVKASRTAAHGAPEGEGE